MNVQSCVGYRVCLGMRGVVLCKSRDVEIVQDAGSVFITGRKENGASAKNISVRSEWLRQNGRAPSEPPEPPRWRITPRPASTPRVALHIALRWPFRHFFSLCRSPILNKHCGVVANCDHTSEWVHWVHVCIRIAMGDAVKISPRVPSTSSSGSVGW